MRGKIRSAVAILCVKRHATIVVVLEFPHKEHIVRTVQWNVSLCAAEKVTLFSLLACLPAQGTSFLQCRWEFSFESCFDVFPLFLNPRGFLPRQLVFVVNISCCYCIFVLVARRMCNTRRLCGSKQLSGPAVLAVKPCLLFCIWHYRYGDIVWYTMLIVWFVNEHVHCTHISP